MAIIHFYCARIVKFVQISSKFISLPFFSQKAFPSLVEIEGKCE